MAKKKKTLPANFNELIEAKDLDALKAVFNECELNAYERRSFKTPALSFYKIPLELMDWLIAQGADVNARDEYECTPLHYHAQVNNIKKVLLPKIFLTTHRTPIYRAVMGENIQARIVRRCIFSSILSKKRLNNIAMKRKGSNKTYSISFM